MSSCKKLYYYSQGFRISREVATIEFILSLSNKNYISVGKRIVIHFKPNSSTEDFRELIENDPSISYYINIDSNKLLKAKRRLVLEPGLIKCNDHYIEVYDLDGRAFNYVVTSSEQTSLLEDSSSTTWLINTDTISNPNGDLDKIISKSKYFFWDSLPINEFYSYQHVNTSGGIKNSSWQLAHDKDDLKNSSIGTTGPGSFGQDNIPTAIAEHNNPIDFNSYTKWRLELAPILLSFYENLSSKLSDEYNIYIDGKKYKCLDEFSGRRIDINFQGFGNLRRRAHMYHEDLYQNSIIINVTVSTPDQLEYMQLKKYYQNYKFLTNFVRFETNDKLGLPWTSHIWWDNYEDNQQLGKSKDMNSQTLAYSLSTRATIYYYEVEDLMYKLITKLRVVFENIPNKPEYLFTLQDI